MAKTALQEIELTRGLAENAKTLQDEVAIARQKINQKEDYDIMRLLNSLSRVLPLYEAALSQAADLFEDIVQLQQSGQEPTP